jgi:Flp pilus assembly protein TadG
VSPRLSGGDEGMVTIWTAVVALACLLIVGLVLDGGTVLRARSRSFDLAGAAARVGIQELDEVALTEGLVVLDEMGARQAAMAYLGAHDATGEVTITGLEVQVTVTDAVALQILRPGTGTVAETATAHAAQGAP